MKKENLKEIIIKEFLENFKLKIDNESVHISFYSSSLFPLYLFESDKPLEIKNHTFSKIAIKKIQNKEMAYTEFEGLQLLYNFKARTPFPITVIEDDGFCLLLMEFIEKKYLNPQNKNDLILSLKKLYQHRGLNYGLDKNNFIGTLLQVNQEYKKFINFWWECRLEPMMNLAINKGHFNINQKNQLYKIIKQFLNVWKLEKDLPRPIHGDLWSGNILFSEQYAYLIDPSFAYSHPVQDFAMLELFGSPLSFSDYQEIAYYCNFTLFPEMIEFFQIYPLLVHVNIFGSSYKAGIMNFINKYK